MRLSTRSPSAPSAPSAATRAAAGLSKWLYFIILFLSIGLFASGAQAAEQPCHSQPLAAACWRPVLAGVSPLQTSAPPAWLRPAFEAAAQAEGVPQALLEAIAVVESGYQPWAVHAGGPGGGRIHPTRSSALAAARRAGPGASLGLMQIQRRWLAQLGVPLERAFDPEANVRLGARILRLALDRHGLRAGIEAYHGQPGRRCTAAYRLRVLRLALALSSSLAQSTPAATSAGDPVPTDPTATP